MVKIYTFSTVVSRVFYVLQFYNLIEQQVSTPIICHGFSLFPDGKMIYFKSEDEPRKHHTIQVWQTPFTAADYIPEVTAEHAQSRIYKIGNKEVVSCMAECREVINLLSVAKAMQIFTLMLSRNQQTFSIVIRLKEAEIGNLSEPLDGIRETQLRLLMNMRRLSVSVKKRIR